MSCFFIMLLHLAQINNYHYYYWHMRTSLAGYLKYNQLVPHAA